MAGVFQNIDPLPPLTARRVCTPRLWCGGRTPSLGGEGGGGSILWKTSYTALFSTYLHKYFASPSKKIKIICLELATRIRRICIQVKEFFVLQYCCTFFSFPCPASGGAESPAEGPGPALRVKRAQQGREEKVRRLGRRGGQKPHRWWWKQSLAGVS